jgi:hypothetical protein
MAALRHILAHPLALLLAGGCALSHDGPGSSGEASEPPRIDAGSATGTPTADAGPLPGEEPEGTEPAGGSCTPRDTAFSISLSTIEGSSEECEAGEMEGWVTGDVTDREGTLEFALSSCPPTADCDTVKLCRIRLEGLEGPLGAAIEPRLHLSGWASNGYVRLYKQIFECCGDRPGCFCGPYTVLYAHTGSPEAPPPGSVPEYAETLQFNRGSSLCALNDCGPKPFFLEAEMDPGRSAVEPAPESITVQPGETEALGSTGMQVRLLSSSRDPCTDEPGTARWIAWLESDG